ncbi:MAG: LysR family transcriptional regulator [Clostridia bacterium]|nr:LysR family transcriptional regulator [Clostridia bacterium]
MEIRNLMTFIQVAELNSFTKASRALDYSQSTISFQIKQLEDELDCLLFERINHTISLTERGRELLEYAHKISNLTEEFNQSRISSRPVEASLHILAPDSVCEDMLTANYVDFHAKNPGISLKFTSADTATMFGMLNHNEGDIMLTLDNRIYETEYVIAKEEPVAMRFVTGSNSPFATNAPLTVNDIMDYPFILTEKGMGYRSSFDKAFAARSIDTKPILEMGRTDIILSILERGVGVSFLPEFVTRKKVAEGKLVYLDVVDFKVDIWKQLIYHRSKWISRGLLALLNYIKENEFGRNQNEM